MRGKMCIDKRLIPFAIVLLLICTFYTLFSGATSKQKNTNAKAAAVNALEKLKKTNKDYLAECVKYSGNSNLGCIYAKSHGSESLDSIGKPRLYFKGQLLQRPKNANGNPSVVDIGPLFVSSDLSDQYAGKIQNLILNSWSSEGINKRITMSDMTVHRFDSTVTTDCYFDEYWSNIRVYYPNAFCEAFASKYPVAFQRIGYGGQMSTGEQNYIWGDVAGDLSSLEYTVKHELGHVLGSWDNDDYGNIQGNLLFPEGRAHVEGDSYYDIMYYPVLYVKDFTRFSINNTPLGQFFDPYPFWQNTVKLTDDKGTALGNKPFYLYAGIRSANHVPGTITDDAVCKGTTDQAGSINMQNICPDFYGKRKENRYIAGFFSVDIDSKEYKGSFDLMESVMSMSRKEPYLAVTLRHASPDESKQESLPAPIEFVTLTNDSPLHSLKTIRIAVRSVPYLNFKNWNLCFSQSPSGTCKTLLSGNMPINENSALNIDIPDELKKYQGALNLRLLGTYTIPQMQRDVTYHSEVKAQYDDKPVIDSVAMQSSVLTVNGDGFLYYQKPAEIFIDGKSYTDAKDFKYRDYTNNRLQTNIDSGLGNSIHIVKVVRDGISSDAYEFIPGVDNNILGINGPLSKYVIDPAETIIAHMEIDCKKNLSDLVFGIDSPNSVFNDAFQFKKPSCSEKEHIIYNFRIPAKTIFDKLLNSDAQANDGIFWYGCSIQDDVPGLHFENQDPKVVRHFNLKKGYGVFYNCLTGDISFEKRAYN